VKHKFCNWTELNKSSKYKTKIKTARWAVNLTAPMTKHLQCTHKYDITTWKEATCNTFHVMLTDQCYNQSATVTDQLHYYIQMPIITSLDVLSMTKKHLWIICFANSQFQRQSRRDVSNAENRPVTFFTRWTWSLATFTTISLLCLFQQTNINLHYHNDDY